MAMRFASCQSARLRLRVSSHGLSKASLERELVIATVSGPTTPEDRATRLDVRMAVRTVAQCPSRNGHYTRSALENFVRAAMSEDDACTLRANSNALGSQTKYWRLIMQYGKSQEAIDRLTAEQRRVTQEAGT